MDENMNYTEQNAAQQPEQQPFEQQPQENGFTMYDQQQYYQQQVPQWGAPYAPQQPPVPPAQAQGQNDLVPPRLVDLVDLGPRQNGL